MESKGKTQCILSPTGTVFKSRRSAYEAMVADKWPNEDIEAMRSVLKHEGWLDNMELPMGWKIKQTATNTFYMDRGGQMFKSSKKAAKFVSEYSQFFTEEDVDKINKIARINQPQKEKKEQEWTSNDPVIPLGWMSRKVKKRRMVKNPDGVVFKSLRLTLEHLMKCNKFSEAERIRECLLLEGWTRMEAPEQWLYKTDVSRNYAVMFISKEGIKFDTKKNAINHVRKLGQFKEELRENFDNAGKENKKRPKKIFSPPDRLLGSRSKKASEPKIVYKKGRMTFEDIQEMLNSRDEVKIKEARSHLKGRGWVENIYLPVSWMSKTHKHHPASSMINVMSPCGQMFSSYKALIRFLKDNPEYQEEDIRKLARFPDGKNHKKIEALIMSVLQSNTFNTFLDEKITRGRKTLKQYIAALRSKRDTSEILEIKKCLLEDGWKEDESVIPRNWLLRQKPGLTTITFVTDTGELLSNVKEANKHLKTRGNGHTFYIDGAKCKSLFVDNYELELKRIEKLSKVNANASQVQEARKENNEMMSKNYVSEKFSLDVLDMERNQSISGFKDMFQQLEKFKKSVMASPSTGSSFDFDLL